ncbi:MAG: FKBP-type peptidyl-prolyl cis-trans isomerase [Pseudomonadota bacterium]
MIKAKFGLKLATTLVLFVSQGAWAADEKASETTKKPDAKSISYAIGSNSARYIQNTIKRYEMTSFKFDAEAAAKGFLERLQNNSTVSDEEVRVILTEFTKEMEKVRKEQETKIAAENKKKGDAFLAANAKKSGVKTLESGLQYKVLTEGKGKKPAKTDTVRVHYKGTLIDGTEFDSSYKRNKPAEFPVTGVIRGWVEALQLMPIGSKWELTIPADLAYGSVSRPSIPANSVLVFEVELLDVVTPKKAEGAQKKGDGHAH